MHQRIVVLGQEVDDSIANRICAELLLLSAEDQRRDISLSESVNLVEALRCEIY